MPVTSPPDWRARLTPPLPDLAVRMVADRREIHRNPELAYEESRTAALAAQRLGELGWEVRTGVGRTGVVGFLRNGPGPVVLWRADMDALPLHEEAAHEYVSRQEGVMHACGHDAHVAIALGLAELLARRRDAWTGAVKVCFQPAEEGERGAMAMIDDGLLEDPAVDAAFALHVYSGLPVGRAAVREGTSFAGCRDFEVAVEGSGGHAALPHQARDPIPCAAQLVAALQSVVARRVDPMRSAVLTVATLSAGTRTNVIPDRAVLTGTMRAHERELLDLMGAELRRIAEGVASAHGCRAAIRFDEGYPPVVNDPAWAAVVRGEAESFLGPDAVGEEILNGSEDMSHVFERVPGCYFLVGAGNEARGISAPHHSARFDVDEDCLLVGAELAWRVTCRATAVAGQGKR